jgi:hypothetical protein
MNFPGYRTLTMSARWLRSRFSGGALILGYHRVAAPVWDPYEMCVAPQRFAEQLEVLREPCQPAIAAGAGACARRWHAAAAGGGRNLRRRLCGYPHPRQTLLERYRIPATVFATSAYLGRAYWWDEVERLLRPPTPVPARLSLAIGGHAVRVAAGPAQVGRCADGAAARALRPAAPADGDGTRAGPGAVAGRALARAGPRRPRTARHDRGRVERAVRGRAGGDRLAHGDPPGARRPAAGRAASGTESTARHSWSGSFNVR